MSYIKKYFAHLLFISTGFSILNSELNAKIAAEIMKEELADLNEFLNRIPADKVIDAIMNDKKITLIQMIIEARKRKSGDINTNNDLFKPQLFPLILDNKYQGKN